MSTGPLTTETIDTSTRLHGRLLLIARGSWLILAVFIVGVFLAVLPIRYNDHFIETLVIPRRWADIHVNPATNVSHDIRAVEADFTPSLQQTGPLTADLMYTGRGCTPDLPYKVDIKGKIVLVDRGGCIFLEKVQNAEKAGALAVIVARGDPGPLGNMVGTSRANIPAMLITKTDGDTLRETAPKKTVNVTISFSSIEPSPAAKLGISREFYAGYRLALNIALLLASLLMSLVIVWRRSENWMALLVALTLLAFGTSPISSWSIYPSGFPFALSSTELLLVNFIATIADLSIFIVMFLLFPNGRLVPRWMWMIGAASFPWVILRHIFYQAPGAIGGPFPLAPLLVTLAFFASGIFAQIYRYRYVSTSIQREQTRWVVLGLVIGVIGNFAGDIGILLFPSLDSLNTSSVIYDLVDSTFRTFANIFALLTIAIAILRYHLWDIDIIINRTLVYGGLTIIVIGIYVLIVGGLGTAIQASGNLLISVLATGLVAVLVQPLRDRLQLAVNRMMYGERDDPITVLSKLGQRLEATVAPDAILPALVETITQALKLPYAAITWGVGKESEIAAAHGRPVGELTSLPLTHQGETIGQLVVASRSPGEAFSPADRHLLRSITHQAGLALYAVGLTVDLQRSRQQLVTAREEERRRLRRELHEGLGSNLASKGLKLATIKQLLESDPPSAIPLLEQVMMQNQSTVEEVRRLAHGLRPPALDELGLMAAIRDYVAGMERNSSLQIEIIGPSEGLPSLPAAVEVAAYRIVLEALTNVIRHAQARHCAIRFSSNQNGSNRILQLEIQDDGVELPPDCQSDVRSMRERAEELGGTCVIVSSSRRGTSVRAELPLIHESEV